MSKRTTRGAMLLEVLILAPIISALATVSVLSVKRMSEEAEISNVAANLKKITAGLELYALDHGHYPSAQLQSGKPGTQNAYSAYLDPVVWRDSAPLGGRFDWQDAHAGIPAGICIRQFTASPDVLLRLDEQLDDNSLDTGRLQLTAGGTRLIYTLNAPQ